MARTPHNRNRPPLDADALRALALAYVGRFATTRAKLAAYLARKLDERGWAEETACDVAALVDRIAALGYVDDRAFGAARVAALARRGYGARRQDAALRAAGIGRDDAAAVRDAAGDDPLASALAFARRRRIGPFAEVAADPVQRRRQTGAMLRAGHDPAIVRRIVAAPPGEADDMPR